MNTYAVDFECYYDKSLSIKIQGNVNYSRGTHIYLVSIYGVDTQYVGDLEMAPWERICGHRWVSHNASFDQAVFREALAKGQIPAICDDSDLGGNGCTNHYPYAVEWDCTADLSAYCGVGRSLKDAVKCLWGIDLPKTARDKAKGKKWPGDFTESEREEMKVYALKDAEHCWNIWNKLSPHWPEKERQLSKITRRRCLEGIYVDQPGLVHDQFKLLVIMGEAKEKIPWGGEGIIRSLPRIKDYCEQQGIRAPASTAEDSPDCEVWEQEYGERHPLVGAIRDHCKANFLWKKLTAIRNRIMPNGRMNFGLKYFGAHTGRFSGAEGVNMQNLPKDPWMGVDLRSKFVAPPGKKFVICDLSQIEPRCTAYVTGNKEMLLAMSSGYGIYEAFALSTNVWNGEPGTLKAVDKDLYALCKAQVLALGYGCGPEKFIYMAKLYAGLELGAGEAQKIVYDFRTKNSLIVNLWKRLERAMALSASRKEPYSVTLPSGRVLKYRAFEVRGHVYYEEGYNGRKLRAWGALLLENVIQATARDVLVEGILRLEAAGIPVIFSAHDEVVCEIDEDFDGNEVKSLMTIPPDWAPSLPLDAEFVESKHYLK